jgi:hypothetical protein
MATNSMSILLTKWAAVLASAGISELDLLYESAGEDSEPGTDSGEARFRWGKLTLRFVRDRGQDFVDIAPDFDEESTFRMDDLGVAKGWRSIEDILSRQTPISLADELREIVAHRREIEDALSPHKLAATVVAVRQACKRREFAFLEKLKKLAEGQH